MTNSSSAIESSSRRRAPARGRRRRRRSRIGDRRERRIGRHFARRLRLRLARLLAGGRELVAHHVAARLLERAVERRLEQVGVGEVVDVGPADDPQPDALLAAAVHLAGVVDGELASGAITEPPWRIGSPSFSWRKTSHGSSGVADSASRPRSAGSWSVTRPRPRPGAPRGSCRGPTACRSQFIRRNSSRSWDFGPWFVTTVRSSCQSGSRVAPLAGRLVEAELRVRQRQAELPDPRHVDRQELLAELLAGLRLDPPVEVAVLRAVAARAVHLHQRAPPAVERLLDRRPLGRRSRSPSSPRRRGRA